jgi:hypothetical protein
VAVLTRGLVLLAVGLGLASGAAAQTEPRAPAADIKAAYLLNFARYVDWPPQAFGDSATPLVICAVESPALEQALRRVTEGRTVRGRRVRVAVVRSSEEPVTCHVAYFGGDAITGLPSPPPAWTGHPVLTVGEGEDFLDRGGIVAFLLDGQTVRFAIDQNAARQAGLRVSSRVLALAVRR